MVSFKRLNLILMAGCASLALSACDGATDIASPGTGGDVIINPGTPAPTPTPTPTPGSALVTPATGCPTIADPKGLTDDGVITGPTGTWRVCTLPSAISRSITLPKISGLLYQIKNRVDVGCDGGFAAPGDGLNGHAAPFKSTTATCTTANGFSLDGNGALTKDTGVTLSIEPGVIVFAGTGTSWIAVNRGNKINAVGTADKPIIFTSRDNVLGLNTDSTIGQWGGVVLLGRAPITDCNNGSTALKTCERDTEGAVDKAVFGGQESDYNAGSMKYVQIRYSGYVLSADKELQSLTGEGIGTGTQLDYFQSFNSSDDGAEFFGGSVNFKHYIAAGADDDSLDIDAGVQGNFQYVLLLQRPGQGDAVMEVDSDNNEADLPRQKSNVVNFTAIQPNVSANNEGGGDKATMLVRGNADLTLANGLIISPNNECIRMNGSGSLTDRATLKAFSVEMQCNSTKYLGTGSTGIAYTAADVATIFGSGTNNNNDAFVPSLTNLFVNGAKETAVVAFDAKALNAFFDTTTYVGAVKDANDTWYAGWTCNSSYAAFDDVENRDRSCTSIPTT